MLHRKRVIIESPYAGPTPSDISRNVAYAKLALADSIYRGEAPYASHLLYTQVLKDEIPEERKLGIELGMAWVDAAELVAFYVDFGFSPGMMSCLIKIKRHSIRVPHEIRKVSPDVISSFR
jgi:hypothetical protein